MAPGVVAGLRDAVTVLRFVASEGELHDVIDACAALSEACDRFGLAASGSWLGYHSRVYYRGYTPVPSSARFSPKWGLKSWEGSSGSEAGWTVGVWVEHTHAEVLAGLLRAAGSPDLAPIRAYRRQASDAFAEAKATVLRVVWAELESRRDPFLLAAANTIAATDPSTEAEWAQREQPASVESSDTEALREGVLVPPHVELQAQIATAREAGVRCDWLADQIESIAAYLEENRNAAEGRDANNRVFIGHAESEAWRLLHGYLLDVVGLQPPWFDQVPPQGFGSAERLRRMVDGVAAAFIVVTIEDEHLGREGTLRENVIHELGVFQGRLGLNRAFVLVEEGCEGFEGVQGVAQLFFPRGRIEAAFADIRRVLERAEII